MESRSLKKNQTHRQTKNPKNVFSRLILILMVGCNFGSPPPSEINERKTKHIGEIEDTEAPYPNEEVRIRGRYASVSKNVFTEQVYRETGADRSKANARALATCRQFAQAEAGCVVVKSYSTVLAPSNEGEYIGSWNCFSETNFIAGDPATFRSFLGAGKTVQEASTDAIRRCTLRSGAVCRVARCFNDDIDKI